MYTMLACGEQAGFVFTPSPSWTRRAQMFHTDTHLAFPLCSATVVLLGPRSLHSLSFPKCAVCKFVLLWVSLLFGSSAPQNTLNGFSEKQNTETRRYKGNKAEKEMIHRGFMIGLIQKHATQIHKEINQIKSESSDHGQYYQSDIKLWKSQLWCWIYGTFSLISQVRLDCNSYIKIKSRSLSNPWVIWLQGIMLLIDERVTSCNAALCSRSVLPLLVLHPEVNVHPETFTFFPHTSVWNCRSWSSFQRCQNKKAFAQTDCSSHWILTDLKD